MALTNLDNEQDNLLNFVNNLQTVLGATPTQGAAVADSAITTDLTGVDTGTDMTAAQAAQIEADLANLSTTINTLIARLEAAGLIAS